MIVLNVGSTTVRLFPEEVIALHLICREMGITPKELILSFIKEGKKPLASSIRNYLFSTLIRRTL